MRYKLARFDNHFFGKKKGVKNKGEMRGGYNDSQKLPIQYY